MSLQGFGGVLAVVYRELVDRRAWLSDREFLEDWAVAQVMPGPNVCNLALMFGHRCLGVPGAIVALLGLLVVPLVVLLGVALAFNYWRDWAPLGGMLKGMGAVAAGLIAGSAFKLLQGLQHHVLGRAWLALFVVTGWLATVVVGLPLPATVLGVGGVAVLLTAYRLKQRRVP